MEVKEKKLIEMSTGRNRTPSKKRKSKIALFWEKYPNGTGDKIVNMRAVLR